ncbi:hypothetical protein FRB99_000120 [Tulasnella sp. 403]|nr:hypothetical protein FRB99_000120 [Tulasnella sp. 403]
MDKVFQAASNFMASSGPSGKAYWTQYQQQAEVAALRKRIEEMEAEAEMKDKRQQKSVDPGMVDEEEEDIKGERPEQSKTSA